MRGFLDSWIRAWILVFVGGFKWILVFVGGFVDRFLDSYTDSRFRCGFLNSWWILVDSKRVCTRFGGCQTSRAMLCWAVLCLAYFP